MVSYDTTHQIFLVNYIGFIPVLIEAVKEQQTIIQSLEKEVKNLQNTKEKSAAAGDFNINDNIEQIPVLYQNQPNPFNKATSIKMFIPGNSVTAFLYIYNMQGTQLKSYTIIEKGDANIIISSTELSAGMYMYTLVVDGQEVDTKRMILTD